MTKTLLILVIIIFVLQGCGKNDPNNSSYKNNDYIWFVADSEEEGEWIKLDNNNEGEHLKNGSYEMYYSNGDIYEKGHFNEHGDYDTAWYFDTSGIITHYTVNENDDYKTYILKEGNFSAFSTNGELIITGINDNNQFNNVEFHGPLQIPLKLLCVYFEAYETNLQNRNKIVPLMEQIINKRGVNISYLDARMDSINEMNKKHLELLKIQLAFTQNATKTREMKNDIIDFLDVTIKQMNDDYPKLFALSANGLTNEERTKANEILNTMEDVIKNATDQVMKRYKVIMEPFKYQDYLYDLMDPFITDCKAPNN